MLNRSKKIIGLLVCLAIGIFAGSVKIHAATVEELRAQIVTKTEKVKQLEAEIAQYEQAVGKTQAEATTIKVAIATLENTRKQLQAEIAVTNAKIDTVSTVLDKLSLDIQGAKQDIDTQQAGLGSVVRNMYRVSDRTPIEVFFSTDTLSGAWHELAALEEVENGMHKQVNNLASAKRELEARHQEQESQKKNLQSLQGQLADQRAIADQNKRTKAQLLAETKSKETAYAKMLADRKALKDQVEAELLDYESRLKVVLDAARLPGVGSGVLLWPLDKVIITQQFGDTSFSRANPLVYSGKGHNGIDLGTPIGTPVYASSDGNVTGAGNTDLGCPGGSYGKWVLITHNNGLATLYAHLSLVKVVEGQTVASRDLIAYSGNTGYSTGPHLHFTVYASQGVVVDALTRTSGTRSSCGRMPLSPLPGYLNPILYLTPR